MIDVVGITFKDRGKVYYFDPGKYALKKGITVIVKTERGLQFGKVELPKTQISKQKLKQPLSNVIKIASKQDYQTHKKNIKDAKDALKKCKELVIKYNLNMNIIDSSYTFDKSQLLFTFVSDARVDFRKLAKDLANIYKTRIELRQVGVRDKAREIGGCGQCGRSLCCSKFLYDFDSVSINMAKNQNISLNPNKINGVCGRLLCCLKYEDECYKECRKKIPCIGKKVKTEHGEGKVISVDILKQKYRVDVPEYGIVECEVKNEND